MHAEALVIVLVLIFGCAAFFFGVICLIWRAMAWVGRGVLSIVRPSSGGGGRAPARMAPTVRICPQEHCRRVDYRGEARYCSQCGSPMR